MARLALVALFPPPSAHEYADLGSADSSKRNSHGQGTVSVLSGAVGKSAVSLCVRRRWVLVEFRAGMRQITRSFRASTQCFVQGSVRWACLKCLGAVSHLYE